MSAICLTDVCKYGRKTSLLQSRLEILRRPTRCAGTMLTLSLVCAPDCRQKRHRFLPDHRVNRCPAIIRLPHLTPGLRRPVQDVQFRPPAQVPGSGPRLRSPAQVPGSTLAASHVALVSTLTLPAWHVLRARPDRQRSLSGRQRARHDCMVCMHGMFARSGAGNVTSLSRFWHMALLLKTP